MLKVVKLLSIKTEVETVYSETQTAFVLLSQWTAAWDELLFYFHHVFNQNYFCFSNF